MMSYIFCSESNYPRVLKRWLKNHTRKGKWKVHGVFPPSSMHHHQYIILRNLPTTHLLLTQFQCLFYVTWKLSMRKFSNRMWISRPRWLELKIIRDPRDRTLFIPLRPTVLRFKKVARQWRKLLRQLRKERHAMMTKVRTQKASSRWVFPQDECDAFLRGEVTSMNYQSVF